MPVIFRKHLRMLFFSLGSLLMIASLTLPITIEYAQTGCPPVSNNGWPKCTIVYYTITGFDSTQKPQIVNALTSWNTTNLSNNSKVKFVQDIVDP